MLPTPATPSEIISALLGGSPARCLRRSIGRLSLHDYRELSCTLCCIRNEVAANCQERAREIDRVLERNGSASSPANCKIYAMSSGHCPLIEAEPLDLFKETNAAKA